MRYCSGYLAPRTMAEALDALAEGGSGALPIAGGTDLLVRIRAGIVNPTLLVDLRALPMDYVHTDAAGIRIGARTTHAQVLRSDLLQQRLPLLVDACSQVAGPPIRNRATIGGNLVNGSPAADTAPPLLACDATVLLVSVHGEREVPLAAFFDGPRRTVLQPHELLAEVRSPLVAERTGWAFIKAGARQAMSIAIASVAVRLTFDRQGRVACARIALGSVAPTPLRARAAETMLQGEAWTRALVTATAAQASREAAPISDLRASADYRRDLVAALVARALQVARDRGMERGTDGGD